MAKSVGREYLEALLVAAIFLGFTNTFVLKTFYIPSGSMTDTLLIGDHLFVNRFIYGSTPSKLGQTLLATRKVQRGDVVIFRSPEDSGIDLVKRCVGVPGDRIELVDKKLYINGQPANDSAYAVNREPEILPRTHPRGKRDNFGPVVVPEDHYFCLGDNRDCSYDSRFWGFVPAHFVKGRAVLVYWSFGGETPDGTWSGWRARLRQLGRTIIDFVPRTRWSRSFQLIR